MANFKSPIESCFAENLASLITYIDTYEKELQKRLLSEEQYCELYNQLLDTYQIIASKS